MTSIELKDYLNQSQAAAELKVTRCTIYRWIKGGKIMTVLVGGMVMVPRSEVERIAAANNEGAVGETTTAPAHEGGLARG